MHLCFLLFFIVLCIFGAVTVILGQLPEASYHFMTHTSYCNTDPSLLTPFSDSGCQKAFRASLCKCQIFFYLIFSVPAEHRENTTREDSSPDISKTKLS